MTILAYGAKAGRTHENQMLQGFLEHLEDRWAASIDWIFVVANSLWNGVEIDLVCILPSAILVADFKSHGGKLTGTENGSWFADGLPVKGGRKTNPYQQLRDNKFSVLNWMESKGLLAGRNLGHIAASAIFSGRIDDQLELPAKVRSWFYATDLNRCASLLDGLASVELKIDRKEAEEIVQRIGVEQITWSSTRPQVRDIGPRHVPPQVRTPLTGHQREALQALCNFTASEELVTFSVLGMTSTGKSRLLTEAVSKIEKSGKKPIVLAPNRRLAMHAPVEAESIYTHLYGGGSADEQEKEITEEKLKVIPLRECVDEEECVYLLDDAHLLGNSRFTTPDGKQYGTGHLLDDFQAFTNLGKSKRKAVFFGDPYQIQRTGNDDSALAGEFQRKRALKHQSLQLTQVIDTTGGSAKLANAERLASAIRSVRFAELDLLQDECFRHVDKEAAAKELLEHYRSDPFSVWYLAETHAQARTLTQWIRVRLHGEQLPESLEVGDLLEIYVGPESKDSVIPSGSRRLTASVGTRESYAQPLKGRRDPIVFHSLMCTLESGAQDLNIFEEFLTSEKPELSADLAIAERVWRKSKRELAALSFTYARYGYASTVHHAQGMSQPICYVNCEHSAGRHSEGFFRWLYSALTVAERELVLLNLTDIHPFDAAVWNTHAVTVSGDILVGAGWSFLPNGVASEKDQQRSLPPGLDQSGNLLKSVAIWLRVANAAEALGWQVAKANCHPYQEQYDIAGPQGEQSQLRIAYNGKNVVTAMHVKDPVYWQFLADVASACLDTNGYSSEAKVLLRSAGSRLGRNGWKVVSAVETSHRLAITAMRSPNERVSIECNFDKQGLVSSLRPLQTSDVALLEEIEKALL